MATAGQLKGARNGTMDLKPAGHTCKPLDFAFTWTSVFRLDSHWILPPGLATLMHHSSLVLWNEPGSEMILHLAGGCGQPA